MNDKGTINILGNGFDIAHGLHTSYSDFKRYIERSKEPEMIFICGDMSLELESLWSDFEENVPYIINEIYRKCACIDSSILKAKGLNWDQRKAAYHICNSLWRQFNNWVSSEEWNPDTTIKRKRIEGIENKLFQSENTTVINFNYTDTPETVYGKIFMSINVHGDFLDSKSIVFGNSNVKKWKELKKGLLEVPFAKNDSIYGGDFKADIDDYERTYNETFYNQGMKKFCKDYSETIPILMNDVKSFCFWVNIEIVNIFGHSFGQLDDPYFEEIYKFLQEKGCNPVWNIYFFSENDLNNAKRLVKKIGIERVKYLNSKDLLSKFEMIEIPIIRE